MKLKYSLIVLLLLFLNVVIWLVMLPKNGTSFIGKQEQRIVTLDWTIAETLLALDIPLAGMGDKKEYSVWVETPIADDSVADLGLRAQPNLSVIKTIEPNLLINSAWLQNSIPPSLSAADRVVIDFYTDEGISWNHAIETTLKLADIVNKHDAAEAMIDKVKSDFQQSQGTLTHYQSFNYAVVQFIDSRHLRIYGENSLYGVVLEQLHLTNAWKTTSNVWGYNQITLVELASLPENTILIVVQPYPANTYPELQKNKLWQNLPFSQPERHRVLPAVWAFGALPSMQRFNYLLTNALIQPEDRW